MIQIVTFSHPALRTKGRKVRFPEDVPLLDHLVEDMLSAMMDAEGIGLAAEQVALPLQLFVLDVPQSKKSPSTMVLDEEPVDLDEWMPFVAINPVIETSGPVVTAEEGCLSLPGYRGPVARPRDVILRCVDEENQPHEVKATGLLARAIQHEYDHLQGILFIDRMTEQARTDMPDDLRSLCRPIWAGT